MGWAILGGLCLLPRCSPLPSSQRGLFSASLQGAIQALAQVFHLCDFVARSSSNVRVLIEPLPRVFTSWDSKSRSALFSLSQGAPRITLYLSMFTTSK